MSARRLSHSGGPVIISRSTVIERLQTHVRRGAARVTGMTRYARFWVEGGEIVGPIKDLRWDESLYGALGSKLMALTAQAEIDPAVDTYFQRALGGSRSPGALIDGFTFTL